MNPRAATAYPVRHIAAATRPRPAPRTVVHTLRLHPDVPELLTVAEVAQLLRVSEMTVYRLTTEAKDGEPELRHIRVGRKIRIHRSDLDAYLRDAYEDGAR